MRTSRHETMPFERPMSRVDRAFRLLTCALALAACSKRVDPAKKTGEIAVAPPPAAAPTPHRATVPLAPEDDVREGSTVALAKLGDRSLAYVADADDRSV